MTIFFSPPGIGLCPLTSLEPFAHNVPSKSTVIHPATQSLRGSRPHRLRSTALCPPLPPPPIFATREATDFSSRLRRSIYMCVESLAIILSFQHKTHPSPAERLVAMPWELVFWALSPRSYPAATAAQVARMAQFCQDTEAALMVPLAKSFNTAGNSPPSLILLHCLDHKQPHNGPLPPNRYSRHEAHSMQHRYL